MHVLDIATSEAFPAPLTDGVRESVIETIGTICGAEPIFSGSGQDTIPCDGIVGVISLVGDVAWSLRLGFPKETAINLAARFAGFEIPYDSSDMVDVVGELDNVLAGDVAARFEMLGVRAGLSLPTVARGRDLEFPLPEGQHAIRMSFSLPEIGDFWLTMVSARPSLFRGRRNGA
jgi:chemotaxis protein CheX